MKASNTIFHNAKASVATTEAQLISIANTSSPKFAYKCDKCDAERLFAINPHKEKTFVKSDNSCVEVKASPCTCGGSLHYTGEWFKGAIVKSKAKGAKAQTAWNVAANLEDIAANKKVYRWSDEDGNFIDVMKDAHAKRVGATLAGEAPVGPTGKPMSHTETFKGTKEVVSNSVTIAELKAQLEASAARVAELEAAK